MIKLFRYLKPYWWMVLILLGLTYVQVETSLALPTYMADIVNKGIGLGDNAFIRQAGLHMLLVSLLGAGAMVIVGFLAARVATSFARDIRDEVFSRVESFSLIEFNKFSTASLITRSTNDIQQIQMVLIMILRMVVSAPLMGIGAIIKAYHEAPSMSWIMILAVVIMMSIIMLLFSVALPKFKLLQDLVDKLNLVTRENLTGLRVIRAFNNEKLEQAKFEKANIDLTSANLFVNRLMVIMQPMMMLVFNASALAIVWFGAKLIGDGSLEIGNMLAFMQYSMQVIMSFLMISIIFIMVPRASVSGQRVSEVIETEPQIKDPEKVLSSTRVKEGQDEGTKTGTVEFKDVTFSYPSADTPVLENISFTAQPGETTGIIGSTGSGKSTLLNLIPRFYDVTKGRVLIDGVDIREMKLNDVYSKLGYVPQKSVIFSGTVESNIKYGVPKADGKTVKHAAKIAHASEFIEKMDDAYKSPIAQSGTNVSGGQKQRLSIARAIAKTPEIYLFDDCFSALDFKTDAGVRAALAEEVQNKTVLIVAQRISTIMSADKIIVLDEGKIVGQGTHAELIKSCPVYREIALSQLSEAELKEHQVDTSATASKQVSKTAVVNSAV